MKTVIFSDSHLSKTFEEKKFRFLTDIIAHADQVIINGDFWDGYTMSFEKFINSSWRHLFLLLKKKKTIYIFGNHDKQIFSDRRTSLFSDLQVEQYTLNNNGETFILEHGHRFHPTLEGKLKVPRVPSFIIRQLDHVEGFLVRKFGKKFIQFYYQKFNEEIKSKKQPEFPNGEILVCGHTHAAEIDLTNTFINTGFVKHGLAQYVVMEKDRLALKEVWYDKP